MAEGKRAGRILGSVLLLAALGAGGLWQSGAFVAAALAACDDSRRKAEGLPPCSLDAPYRSQMEQGRALEEQGRLDEALHAYFAASRVKRYEAESYYALLDAGRVQYKLARYKQAIETLTTVRRSLEHELAVARGETVPEANIPGFTVESILDLLDDIAEADALITASRMRLPDR